MSKSKAFVMREIKAGGGGGSIINNYPSGNFGEFLCNFSIEETC